MIFYHPLLRIFLVAAATAVATSSAEVVSINVNAKNVTAPFTHIARFFGAVNLITPILLKESLFFRIWAN